MYNVVRQVKQAVHPLNHKKFGIRPISSRMGVKGAWPVKECVMVLRRK